jgi:hypothetical protein
MECYDRVNNYILAEYDKLKYDKRVSLKESKGIYKLVVKLKSYSSNISENNKIVVEFKNDQMLLNLFDCEHYIKFKILFSLLKIDISDKIIIDDVKDFIKNLITLVENMYDTFYSYCPLCLISKNKNKMKIYSCDNCEIESYSNVIDNTVMDNYFKDKNVFKLNLLISTSGLLNLSRFNPLPIYCSSSDELKTISNDTNYYIKIIETCVTDNDLFKKLKLDEYKFLKHIVKSNILKLNYYNTNQNIIRDEDIFDTDDNILFTVDHDREIQNTFDNDSNVKYMYHGSSLSNFYSIMRNGLKNYSGTKFQTNGAAYGNGIYLAEQYTLSLSYSRNTKNRIMAIVQLRNHNKYKKSSIAVVNDEKDVLIKYLILVRNLSKNKIKYYSLDTQKIILDPNNLDSVSKYLESNNKNENYDTSMIKIKMKRIENEFKELKKFMNKYMIITKLDMNENYNWLIETANYNIVVEFDNLYPASYPNVYLSKEINTPMVINKKFKDPCMNHYNWSSKIKTSSMIIKLIKNINNIDNIIK